MIKHVNVKTGARVEFIDITPEIERLVEEAGFQEGVCYLHVPHTTAGITVNEGADPSVRRDIIHTLQKIVPRDAGYAHLEGNSDAHIKSSLVGTSTFVLIEQGRLQLGTWQSIFFCEFDGPRHRRVAVKVMGFREP
ncbi:MAG: secondary thiamine-phosphate synthase enzyme YjbQ [Nitrospirota bacterium]|nr:secondary thiamine-phosphate synthase enzyme YjbQ [Nitrospirota bacterium]